ncbi:hypothetical protein FM038_010180 [Shewanella eurypsychrophilus]|uniref:Uncharacterized protein n=1 Tax=Shewanella eurypsychrophilus TaxID=2593656 RepID=A0ABX6V7C4_9GAMM|nr:MULTISPECIES: hypothetical protein [Shewanella]QFU22489.1 hypothetical protein FS418_11760 [Shewanella sp. YLB-09]QPG57776.1 hypothetical protein FM038_010180 [Shewanella eurypsychrophilus]
MFEPLLTQPEIITVNGPSRFQFRLKDTISDIGLLQALSAHIGEFITVEVNSKLSVLYRLHPFLSLEVLPLEQKLSTNVRSLKRGCGQGWRLFSGLGISPSLCSQQLRAGLNIDIEFDEYAQFSMGQVSNWHLIPLEEDVRLFHEPKELMHARAIMSREALKEPDTEQILLELSEVESIRSDLSRFACSELVMRNPEFSIEVLKLDAQLLQKKQWLSRTFNQSVERHNWQNASNHAESNDVQMRKLEYYRLLSTPAVNDMIEQLICDEE